MNKLQIEMALAALALLLIIFFSLNRNSSSIKNSAAWLLLPIAFFLIAVFPDPVAAFANFLGFEMLSNFIFLLVIALLIVICFFLTISNSRQQKQITKLNQELSIIKQKLKK